MNTLELTAIRCTLKHINVRTEGTEEDGMELANDLKFALRTRADIALRALGARDLAQALYDKDDNPLYPEIKALAFDVVMDQHALEIGEGRVEFGNATLKAFAIEFVGPGPEAELTFTAQVYPTSGQQAELAEMLREEIVLTVAPPNTLPGVAKEGAIKSEAEKLGKKGAGKKS